MVVRSVYRLHLRPYRGRPVRLLALRARLAHPSRNAARVGRGEATRPGGGPPRHLLHQPSRYRHVVHPLRVVFARGGRRHGLQGPPAGVGSFAHRCVSPQCQQRVAGSDNGDFLAGDRGERVPFLGVRKRGNRVKNDEKNISRRSSRLVFIDGAKKGRGRLGKECEEQLRSRALFLARVALR